MALRLDRPRRRAKRRFVLIGLLVVALVGFALSRRSNSGLTPLRARIVSIADSQLGYRSDPPDTYCNQYSAYWHSGTADCGNDNLDEEWCADFAAWVWQRAGLHFTYLLSPGDLNAAAASFYSWGLAHGTWHPIGSGYVPQPGDVAVYGLDTSTVFAQHVAIVTSWSPGESGPDVVNGDGSRTAFSIVETGTDQVRVKADGREWPLSGYVAPVTDASAT